ncbi:hypothetical protein P4H66_25970 [Paenibacillus dokdonensis]|uniref:Uncharacterized protein n=1 Tax=Paenibacillus dokdonensis TaxID=2567944 RepID=A0ABU6GXW2_9BACL|nr:hypothetical protein [Paenibacillus dokdonensis]MEC0243266.1 hypothetical protein [Paenibacillus dokdonensis]
MNIVIIIVSVAIVLLLIAAACIEVSKFFLVRKKIFLPFRKFKKTYARTESISENNFKMSRNQEVILAYYLSHQDDILLEMRFEIKSRIGGLKNKALITFLLSTCLPVFSLVVAVFAIISNDLQSEQKFTMFLPTFLILLLIMVVAFIDFSSRTLIKEPLDAHLIAIEEALCVKEKQELNKKNRLVNRRLKGR